MRPMNLKFLNGVRFCSRCGSRMLFQGYGEQHRLAHIMKEKSICYDCAYWQDIMVYPPANFEVIGNQCFKIGPEGNKKDKSIILGGKGKIRYFVRNDLTVFRSNDIWLIGTIPPRFQSGFPSTLREIPRNIFKRLCRNSKRCKAKACFDRYRCLRYNLDVETDGAYNAIPVGWNVGDEHCKFFIDTNEIISDESNDSTIPKSKDGK